MFIDNKYTRLYYTLINKYKCETGERHHIIPKSIGGLDENSNIAIVPVRVHFILHRLLIKMLYNPDHIRKMNYALFMMMNTRNVKFTSREYEKIKTNHSAWMKSNNPMHRKDVIDRRRGQKRSDSTKQKISQANYKRWENKARPLREFNCPMCDTPIKTRIPTKKTCSKKCAAFLRHR